MSNDTNDAATKQAAYRNRQAQLMGKLADLWTARRRLKNWELNRESVILTGARSYHSDYAYLPKERIEAYVGMVDELLAQLKPHLDSITAERNRAALIGGSECEKRTDWGGVCYAGQRCAACKRHLAHFEACQELPGTDESEVSL